MAHFTIKRSVTINQSIIKQPPLPRFWNFCEHRRCVFL